MRPLFVFLTMAALVPATSAFAASPGAAEKTARAFLTVDLPTRPIYVGESVPLTVRAYYRTDTGASLTGAPTLADADFTLHASDPVQGSEIVGGVGYRTLTWKDELSPVKAGTFPIALSVPSTLEWRDAVPHAPPAFAPNDADDSLGDPFGNGGDPFQQITQQMQRMQRLMSQRMSEQMDIGPMQHKDVILRSKGVPLVVHALPTQGRPADFSGAVGNFSVTSSAEPLRGRVGEPVTLTVKVDGAGNFDRVTWSGIAASSDWKTYDPSSVDGAHEKTFHQSIVPLRAGSATIPAASFVYFDPKAETYITVTTKPIAIDVLAGTGSIATSDGTVPPASSGAALAPNALDLGPAADLRPLFTRARFWAAQAGLLALFVLGFFGTRRLQRRSSDRQAPRRREADRAVRAHRAEMDRAIASGDSASFFSAARGAVQERLGSRWELPPAAISLSEIASRLEEKDVQTLRPVFDADAARFSGHLAPVADLAEWKRIVDHELDHLAERKAS